MEYVTLGRSGLKVSRACLGTMNFGSSEYFEGSDETEAARVIHAFLDEGHNFLDTADNYADGQSEEIVGRAVKGRRDSVVIATKGFMPHGRGPNDRGLSRLHLTRALEASLRRLGTDYIDLYQCHGWDDTTPIEETMMTLDGFVRSGKVRYLGCSNFTASQIVEAQWAAQRAGTTPFVSLQPQYSLVARNIEAEILPVCRRHGLGTAVWSPLGGGALNGRHTKNATPAADTRIGQMMASPIPIARLAAGDLVSERVLDIAEEVRKIAVELGSTPAAVALSWVRQRPGVTSVIIGPRSLDQLHGNFAGFALELPEQAAAHLERISRTPAVEPVNGMANPRLLTA
ncbi:aldo/keto reductase [Nonomuraea sp. K274]|uniref:Aldo/keto reductase n=1 Tax=Nonomuraea cypriaca TaxID=1187855 RepID=A0A931F5Z4_9ACTN|nr:aldo/keto reductase [Nonomuraea cypriaca]MBF8192698.1 aldo/keto reductase [Nonomuraea cypriaca]